MCFRFLCEIVFGLKCSFVFIEVKLWNPLASVSLPVLAWQADAMPDCEVVFILYLKHSYLESMKTALVTLIGKQDFSAISDFHMLISY